MKKRIAAFIVTIISTVVLAGCGDSTTRVTDVVDNSEKSTTEEAAESTETESATQTVSDGTDMELLTGKHHVEIEVANYGTIKVELDADAAPISTTNFIELARDGFYDGLTFHRIISGFMIQGGDPTGTGMGGSDRMIKGEFSDNGVQNDLSHTRGAISMARSADMDSASSQFFIVHEDSDFLDGQYAVFGYVTEGMEYVDKICQDTKVEDNNGTVSAENQPVITRVTVMD
ncbi:MAG: peptidylprolyl isomerase [Lachnospiraceae bacterium]|nr:peptidylprolyl isomerase [Lachnospiraceae bacterium]